jgi:hypothetical protein
MCPRLASKDRLKTAREPGAPDTKQQVPPLLLLVGTVAAQRSVYYLSAAG